MSSALQRTLEMLREGLFSEDLAELLEFQLLVVDAVSQITNSSCFTSVNPSFTRENYYDAFLEGELNGEEENKCIWSQLYEFLDTNSEKIEKILSKNQFLLPQYYSLLENWIHLLRDLQKESFLKKRVGDYDRVIPKYNKIHLKYLQKLLLLLVSPNTFPRCFQESIIDLLEHAATLDSSYLTKFNLKEAFEVAEQQILEEFFLNIHDQLHPKKEKFTFPRILRVIGRCFQSQWDYHSLNNDDNTLLTEMQNSKLFKGFFALYDRSPKIVSDFKDRSLLNDYLSIIQFLILLEKVSPVLYNDENYKPKFKLVFKDAMGSELQLIDQFQYSLLVNDLVRVMQSINFWNEPQDEQTVFLYFKFFFFQPKQKINSGNGEEYRFRNRFSYMLDRNPDHKSFLAEITLSLLSTLQAKTRDGNYDIWEELRKVETDIIEKEQERIKKKQKEQEEAARANEEAKEDNEEAKQNTEDVPANHQAEVQQEEGKKEDLPNPEEKEVLPNPGEQGKFKFAFSPDSLVFDKNFDLQFYQDFVMRVTYKGLLTAYSVATFSGYIDHEKKYLIYDGLKASCKLAMTPLLIFMTPFCVSKSVYYLRETYYNGDNQLNSIIDGLITGMNTTFETFNLNDKTTFNSINMENIFVVMAEITEKNVVTIEAIPKNFTWREAALASLILMLKNYGRYFKNERPTVYNDFTPEFNQELSKANQSLKDLIYSLLKEMSRGLLNKHKNQNKVNWKGFSKDWLQVLSSIENIIGGWEGFCTIIRRRTSSEKTVDDLYKSWVCEFDLSSETATYEEKKVNLAENLGIFNCFINILPCQNGNQYQKDVFIPLFSKTEIFDRVLSLEKDVLSSYYSGSDADDKSLELHFLETQSQRILRNFYNSESFNVTTFDNSGYEARTAQNFKKIKEFLTDPLLSTIVKTNNETLIVNAESAIDCCLDVYKIYGYFITHQANKVDHQLKLLKKDQKKKNKKDTAPRPAKGLFDESDDDNSMGFGLFDDPDDYYEPQAEVIQEPQVEAAVDVLETQVIPEVQAVPEVQEAQTEQTQISEVTVEEIRGNTGGVIETQEQEEERKEEIPPPLNEEEEKTDLLVEEESKTANEEEEEEKKKVDNTENSQPTPAVHKEEEEEVDDFFGGFNVDIEESSPVKKKEEVKDDAMEMRIAKLEDEKKQFYDQFKSEVEYLFKSCLPNLLLFTSLDGKLLNLKITHVTISEQIWLDQYESHYKTLLLYLGGLLDESDAETKESLEKEAADIDQNSINMDLFTVKSSVKALGELATLRLVYHSLTKFFSLDNQRKFKLSSDFIYGFSKVISSKLKELLTQQDLPLAKEEINKTHFFDSLANLLDDLAELAIYFITKNKGSDPFLLLSLELFENSFLTHELALNNFDVSFLEGESCSLLTTLVNLANVILLANKNLRVKFVERGLFEKLLITKRFELWDRNETNALVSLFITLLEDSLPFETQVELQIKEFIRINRENRLSLDSLLDFSKMKLFKNNPKSFNPVKTYGLACKKNIDDKTDVNIQLTLDDFEIQEDFTERTKLIDYTKGSESTEKVNAIEYLQRAVSPLAQKCIQNILHAFVQNLEFERETIRYCAQQKLEKEQKQQEALSKLELQRIGDSNQQEAADLLEVLQQGQNLAKISLKEIRILLELLTSLMYNYPGLVPYLVFQEFEGGQNLDFSKYLPQRSTVLDVLLTYTLCRDGENALFLVGSLLKTDTLSVELNQGTIKNVFLSKIFDIINAILDIDNNQGAAFSNFDTTTIRFHIAHILAFINKLTSTEEGFDNKDKINDLVVLTTQKLLKNIGNAFKLVAETSGPHFITQVSKIIRTNMPEAEGPKNTQDYINLLKALEKDSFAPDKNFQFTKFNQFIFRKNEKDLELKQDEGNLNEKELKSYEMQKFSMITGPANLCDLSVEFPMDGSTLISDELTLAQLWENLKNQNLQHIIYYRKQNQGPQEKNYIEYLEYYRQNRPNPSHVPQPFKNRIDPNQDHFKSLDIFWPSQKVADDLKNSHSLFSSFVQDEQARMQKILQEKQKVSSIEKANTKNEEEEKGQQETLFNEEDQKTAEKTIVERGENENELPFGGLFGEEEENPNDQCKVYPARSERKEIEDLNKAEYFVRDKIQSEGHFKYLVNKTLKNARRLKEVVQLEKTYNSMVRKEQTSGAQIEEIIKHFTKSLDEFDKNIIYTALGKEIQSSLSTEMQSHIEMLNKQFKAIKDDFYSYQTANKELLEKRKQEAQEKIEKTQSETQPPVESSNPDNLPVVSEGQNQNPEEVKENENNDEDPEEIQENSHYDEYDYDDFKFVKDQEKKIFEEEKEEEKKEDVTNLSDGGSAPSSQIIDATDNQEFQDSKEDPEITKRIHFFRLDDETVLELCMPFFGDYSKKTSVNPITEFSNFLNNSLFANPANEFAILDTLLFILYTPELIKGHSDELPHPLKTLNNKNDAEKIYEIAAQNIIELLYQCLNKTNKAVRYFTPLTSLNKFGNKLLVNLKEKTGFYKKIENCYSILDLVIGLLENKTITQGEQNVQNILDSVKNILSTSSNHTSIVLGRGNPQAVTLKTYKNYFSPKNLNILFNLSSEDTCCSSDITESLSDLVESFKSHPKLLISMQDDLINIFSSSFLAANKTIEQSIQFVKQHESLTQDEFKKTLDLLLKVRQTKTVELTHRCFASACYEYCFSSEGKKDQKIVEKISSLLQTLVQTLFNQEDVQKHFVNVYEILEIIRKQQDRLQVSESLFEESIEALLKVCLLHYSMLLMASSLNTPSSKNPSAKGDSLPELDQLPKLKKLVTKDHYETKHLTTFQKTFSFYKSQPDLDFQAIFANFALKYSTPLSNLRLKSKDRNDQLLQNIFFLILPRCPWLLDLASKKQIIRYVFFPPLKT